MRKTRSPIFPIVFFFIITTGFFVSTKKLFERYEIDQEVVIIGNLVLFAVTFLSFLIGKKTFDSSNPQAFVRGIILGTMLKLLICAVAAFVYIMMFRENLNKMALVICMVLYIIYTFIEVTALKKLLKENNA
jgi:hypothetical protein